MNIQALIAKLEDEAQYLHGDRELGATYIINSLKRKLEDMAIVPVEPTEKMEWAGFKAVGLNTVISMIECNAIYKAMLSIIEVEQNR